MRNALPLDLQNPQAGMTDAEKLKEIRKICLDLDTMITQNPKHFMVSGQWFTGHIMCVAKYGDGYPDSRAPETHSQTRFTPHSTPKT